MLANGRWDLILRLKGYAKPVGLLRLFFGADEGSVWGGGRGIFKYVRRYLKILKSRLVCANVNTKNFHLQFLHSAYYSLLLHVSATEFGHLQGATNFMDVNGIYCN
jgi:hypothetical protein